MWEVTLVHLDPLFPNNCARGSRMESELFEKTAPCETLAAAEDDAALQALDRSCVRSLDWSILPIASALYFLSFVDRSNIGQWCWCESVSGAAADCCCVVVCRECGGQSTKSGMLVLSAGH